MNQKLNEWAEVKAKTARTLVVVCGKSTFSMGKPPNCISIRNIAAIADGVNIPISAVAYVCRDASIDDAQAIYGMVLDVVHEDPTKRPLWEKVRDWSERMHELGHLRRLIVLPKDRFDEHLRTGQAASVFDVYCEGGEDVWCSQADAYDAVLVCRPLSLELRVLVDDVGKTVWVEDGDEPRPKGILPRLGDAIINRIRVPNPAYHFDDEGKVFSVSTEIDVEKDAACLNELWANTTTTTAHIAASRSVGIFPVTLIRREWHEHPLHNSSRTAKLTFWFRHVELDKWSDFKSHVAISLAKLAYANHTQQAPSRASAPEGERQVGTTEETGAVVAARRLGVTKHTVGTRGTVVVDVGGREVVGWADEELGAGCNVVVERDGRTTAVRVPDQPIDHSTTTDPCT